MEGSRRRTTGSRRGPDPWRIQRPDRDFGIAKLRWKRNRAKRITENDAIVGTPDYMPPEQASGVGEVDQRADVWALCLVLSGHHLGATGPRRRWCSSRSRRRRRKRSPPCVGDNAPWAILERWLAKEVDGRY